LLHFRSRSRTLTAARVERARVEERSLVRGWLMRGTVHLVAADDYPWMCPLFAEATSRNSRRRLGQLGMPTTTQDRALRIIENGLRADGVISRPELIERLAFARIEVVPETRVHLMIVTVVEGVACIGPDKSGSGSLALASDWLGTGEPRRRGGGVGAGRPAARTKRSAVSDGIDRERALAELARMYLGAFAPATERDFAKWAGLPLRDCRLGLQRIASELVEVRGCSAAGAPTTLLALRDTKLRAPRAPLVRLLPSFDTYLMGYATRAHAVDDPGERRILPGGGVLRATICVDGRFVGLWASKRNGNRLTVTLEPFEPLDGSVLSALEAEVSDIGRFEGLAAALA
jgi:DNA glycosylase AlkZ-like